jgi:hypothetical protein
MKRIILLTLALVFVLCGTAQAKEWGEYDVTNAGQGAKVWEHTTYDGAWHKTKVQLNNLAGERGVTFNEQGHRGTGGIAYEVEIKDAYLAQGIGGTDYNHIYCEAGKCRSWSTVTITKRGDDQLPSMRHEFGHVLSAPHHACRVHSIMVGTPYIPCSGGNFLGNKTRYYSTHDKRDYADNRRQGVYDDTVSSATLAGLQVDVVSNIAEAKEVAYFHSNADYVEEKKVNGGTLITMTYIPHSGLERLEHGIHEH